MAENVQNDEGFIADDGVAVGYIGWNTVKVSLLTVAPRLQFQDSLASIDHANLLMRVRMLWYGVPQKIALSIIIFCHAIRAK